jgi:hypothetical protein
VVVRRLERDVTDDGLHPMLLMSRLDRDLDLDRDFDRRDFAERPRRLLLAFLLPFRRITLRLTSAMAFMTGSNRRSKLAALAALLLSPTLAIVRIISRSL